MNTPFRDIFKEKEREALHQIYQGIADGDDPEIQNQIINFLLWGNKGSNKPISIKDSFLYRFAMIIQQNGITTKRELYDRLESIGFTREKGLSSRIKSVSKFDWITNIDLLETLPRGGKRGNKPVLPKLTNSQEAKVKSDLLKVKKGQDFTCLIENMAKEIEELKAKLIMQGKEIVDLSDVIIEMKSNKTPVEVTQGGKKITITVEVPNG
jgi:hypothetical protein